MPKKPRQTAGLYHCPSSFSPLSPDASISSFIGGSFRTAVLQRVVGGGASLPLSRPTGKASTDKGGTVETGELHSVLEPLRRASRCRFLYSNKETWKRKKQNNEEQRWYQDTPIEGSSPLLAHYDEIISPKCWISVEHKL